MEQNEKMNEEEGMDVEELVNVKFFDVPVSTLREFQNFSKAYANNKYAIALRLLLDRSAVLEVYSNLNNRVRVIENAMGMIPPVEGQEESKKERKTFGGR